MFNGILWIMKTGAPWRDLPESFGPWQTVYKRFAMWAKLAIWDDILLVVSKDADLESIMIDASYVKGPPAWDRRKRGHFNQDIGRSAGGLTTKVHALVDALGNPLRIGLTGGNVHDIVPAPDLVSSQSADNLLGDKAYDADQFIAQVQSQGIKIVIPPKRNRQEMRDYDRHIYKERHLVECFFCQD